MPPAGPAALDRLAPLLADIRVLPGLVEKGRGVFYRRSKAFLHFHEDPAGLFADIRCADGRDFDRVQVDDPEAREALVKVAVERAGGP